MPPEILRRHPVLEGLIFGGGGLREALHNWLLSRRARRAGRALADALRQCGLIAGSGSRPRVAVHLGATALHVRLHGVEAREEALFVQSLQEIFDPLWSPRYLLVQGRRAFGVPKALGVRRERADAFQHHWRRRVGKARLVYTGSAEGRRRLVQVKQLYLATLHRDIPESRSVWT